MTAIRRKRRSPAIETIDSAERPASRTLAASSTNCAARFSDVGEKGVSPGRIESRMHRASSAAMGESGGAALALAVFPGTPLVFEAIVLLPLREKFYSLLV